MFQTYSRVPRWLGVKLWLTIPRNTRILHFFSKTRTFVHPPAHELREFECTIRIFVSTIPTSSPPHHTSHLTLSKPSFRNPFSLSIFVSLYLISRWYLCEGVCKQGEGWFSIHELNSANERYTMIEKSGKNREQFNSNSVPDRWEHNRLTVGIEDTLHPGLTPERLSFSSNNSNRMKIRFEGGGATNKKEKLALRKTKKRKMNVLFSVGFTSVWFTSIVS